MDVGGSGLQEAGSYLNKDVKGDQEGSLGVKNMHQDGHVLWQYRFGP